MAGMYRIKDIQNQEEKINFGVLLLSDSVQFLKSMNDVLVNWPIASAVNLTNIQQNRRAWLGAAACMYTHGVEEVITRISWGILSDYQKNTANTIADQVIFHYEHTSQNKENLFTKIGI